MGRLPACLSDVHDVGFLTPGRWMGWATGTWSRHETYAHPMRSSRVTDLLVLPSRLDPVEKISSPQRCCCLGFDQCSPADCLRSRDHTPRRIHCLQPLYIHHLPSPLRASRSQQRCQSCLCRTHRGLWISLQIACHG